VQLLCKRNFDGTGVEKYSARLNIGDSSPISDHLQWLAGPLFVDRSTENIAAPGNPNRRSRLTLETLPAKSSSSAESGKSRRHKGWFMKTFSIA
jgi:hypothetical protein